MPKIAITGTIASGKSIASEYIRSKGYEVLDLDRVNANLLNDKEVQDEIRTLFPDAFDPKLNKKKLAENIFNSKRNKKKLENILYPRIKKMMFEKMKEQDPYFVEVPLLFESGFDQYFDESWLVVCDEETSVRRLIEKGYTSKEAKDRIRNQMPVEEKKKRADKIIYNKNTFSQFYEELDKLLKEYLC